MVPLWPPERAPAGLSSALLYKTHWGVVTVCSETPSHMYLLPPPLPPTTTLTSYRVISRITQYVCVCVCVCVRESGDTGMTPSHKWKMLILSPRNAASASLSPTITSHTFMGAPVGCCHREGSEIQFRSVGLRGCMLCTKARRKELLCNMRGTCRRERRSDERWPRIDNDSPHFGSK